jgi:hypothetical protein
MAEKSINTKSKGIILAIAAAILVIIMDINYFRGASMFYSRLAFNVGAAIVMIIIYYKMIAGSKRK